MFQPSIRNGYDCVEMQGWNRPHDERWLKESGDQAGESIGLKAGN